MAGAAHVETLPTEQTGDDSMRELVCRDAMRAAAAGLNLASMTNAALSARMTARDSPHLCTPSAGASVAAAQVQMHCAHDMMTNVLGPTECPHGQLAGLSYVGAPNMAMGHLFGGVCGHGQLASPSTAPMPAVGQTVVQHAAHFQQYHHQPLQPIFGGNPCMTAVPMQTLGPSCSMMMGPK